MINACDLQHIAYAGYISLQYIKVVMMSYIPSQQVSQKRLKTKVFSPLFCDIFFASLRVQTKEYQNMGSQELPKKISTSSEWWNQPAHQPKVFFGRKWPGKKLQAGVLVGSTTLRRLKFFLVAPRTPYFDILWSKPSDITKKCRPKVGKNVVFYEHLLTGYNV